MNSTQSINQQSHFQENVPPNKLQKKSPIQKVLKSSFDNITDKNICCKNLSEKKIQKVSASEKLKDIEQFSKEKFNRENKTLGYLDPALFQSIKEFKEQTGHEILTPCQGISDSDSDIYVTNGPIGLIIKPGLPDARGSIMAQEVLRVVGLNHTVPPMKMGNIQNIKSSQDFDKIYVIKVCGGKMFAIEAETLIPLTSGKLPLDGTQIKDPRSNNLFIIEKNADEKFVTLKLLDEGKNKEYDSENENFNYENKLGSNSLSSDLDNSWIHEFANTPFRLVQDNDGSGFYLAPQLAMNSILLDENSKKIVMRHDAPYYLKRKSKSEFYDIIGYNVPALYQMKIAPLFVGEDEYDGLNMTVASPEREEFYKKVNRESFIESFVSYILTRSHDGKIVKLKNDSNFLFKEMKNGKLRIFQIDLDQVMPLRNNPKRDDKPHPLRCGLMGFPMVDEKLSEYELRHLKKILKNCISQRKAALKVIEMFSKESFEEGESLVSRKRKKAYLEVIVKLEEFLEQNKTNTKFTLKDLFYFVFPSYKRHFELLVNPKNGTKPLSPQLAALQVGSEPIINILNRSPCSKSLMIINNLKKAN